MTTNKIPRKDIVLNVGFAESMKRCIISVFLPLFAILIDHRLAFFVAPVMFYLFVTGLTHFCFIRYAWQHWIKHMPNPKICDLTVDLQIPVNNI